VSNSGSVRSESRSLCGVGLRPLGNTTIRVSSLGVGCGTLAQGSGTEKFHSMLTFARRAGLAFFDSAPLYGGSESLLGEHLREQQRGEYVLATKVGRYPAPGGSRHFDFSRGAVSSSLLRSLERLGTDYIDLLALHDLAPAMLGHDGYVRAMGDLRQGTLECLLNLKARGVIRAIGVATYDPEAAMEILGICPLDYVMIVSAYSLLSQDAADKLIPYCETHGIGVICASPFHSGILATGSVEGARYNFGPASSQIVAQVRRIETFCQRHDVRLAAAALQFPLRNRAVSSVLVGHCTPAEVAANLEALAEPVPEDFWDDLSAESIIPAAERA
jgi:D-threo-aldose 1-dehydrogenase